MSGIVNSAGSRSGIIGTTELDYEEGAWTPAIKAGTTIQTTGTNTGEYIKIGKLVYVSFKAYLTTKVGSTGAITCTGLPFTLGTVSGFDLAYFPVNVLNMYIGRSDGSTVLSFFKMDTSTGGFSAYVDLADCATGQWFMVSGTYST